MSASLVGSEMCIRDRFPPTRGRGRELGGRRALAEHLRRHRGHGLPGRAEAVSYTHLTLPTICSV
eukprot:4446364-Alexandrium_andersonii.AAC.1